MSFHEVRFPTDISYESIGGPQFSTEVIQLSSGHEKRNQNWTYPRERWNVAYGVKSKTLLQALVEFFYARRGRAYGFRFKNHDDYDAVGEVLGTGDANETDFQLVKAYTSGGETLSRLIAKPVANTVALYLDSSLQGSGWSVDTTTGIVTFDSAPGAGVVVSADFEFDVPVRFDTDHLPVQFSTYEARSTDVSVVELRVG
jgi:uncharacterized protein (TIGR02217 family)